MGRIHQKCCEMLRLDIWWFKFFATCLSPCLLNRESYFSNNHIKSIYYGVWSIQVLVHDPIKPSCLENLKVLRGFRHSQADIYRKRYLFSGTIEKRRIFLTNYNFLDQLLNK